MTGKPANPDEGLLRQQRDRFVAFAFAAADLLFELDPAGLVTYAAGAVGQIEGEVVGSWFFNIVEPADRDLVRTLVASIAKGGRVAPIPIHLSKAESRLMMFGACSLPKRPGQIFVSLSTAYPAGAKPEEKKILDRTGFAEAATRRMTEAEQPMKLTFVALDGQQELEKRLPQEVGQGLFSAVERYLQKAAGGTGTTGALGEGRYGILSEKPFDEAGFRQEVETLSKSVDPLGQGLATKIQSAAVDGGELSEVDAARALMYCINDFVSGEGADLSSAEFREKLDTAFSEVTARVVGFRSTVQSGSFMVHFQPVVEIRTAKLHHVEALARFDNKGTSPQEMMVFAESMLLIADFDMAVCEKVIAVLRGDPEGAAIAVNLSGRSIESAAFTEALMALVRENLDLAPRLLFEITESAVVTNLAEVNARMQALRTQGFHVCLDDFGAGSNAFHYLRGLQADHVKLDGEFGLAALRNPQDRLLMVSVAKFCEGMGAELIAEKIEQRHEAEEFANLGVRYGQGYFYGKAAPELLPAGTVFEAQKLEPPKKEAPRSALPRGPLNPGPKKGAPASQGSNTGSGLASLKSALR